MSHKVQPNIVMHLHFRHKTVSRLKIFKFFFKTLFDTSLHLFIPILCLCHAPKLSCPQNSWHTQKQGTLNTYLTKIRQHYRIREKKEKIMSSYLLPLCTQEIMTQGKYLAVPGVGRPTPSFIHFKD